MNKELELIDLAVQDTLERRGLAALELLAAKNSMIMAALLRLAYKKRGGVRLSGPAASNGKLAPEVRDILGKIERRGSPAARPQRPAEPETPKRRAGTGFGRFFGVN